jgi:capsular exopolysaccharide synthesis family protein
MSRSLQPDDMALSAGIDEIPIRRIPPASLERVACLTAPTGLAADRFRYLCMKLRKIWQAGMLKSILVTSPLPLDGKSTVALNLATALAEKGRRRVLLIDADLHRGTVSTNLGFHSHPGFTDSLEDSSDPLHNIRRLEPLSCYFLPAGRPIEDPGEQLHSDVVAILITRLSQLFDWVIIDSPPVIPVTDAVSLAQHVDGILLVAKAGKTEWKSVEDMIAILGRRRILGLVLNAVEETTSDYSGYYSKYPAERMR